jgi:hypothetical protein
MVLKHYIKLAIPIVCPNEKIILGKEEQLIDFIYEKKRKEFRSAVFQIIDRENLPTKNNIKNLWNRMESNKALYKQRILLELRNK